ncbi:DNA repair protein rad52 [Lithohypha guttulata]|uniref:DNA repair protein rad52 n=1 Tax=Lithohypha guttulata TaxID=1690604 RepID=UPI002DE1E994|nr:DNA repair protein rad52 [Lithohypha guttulata]
MPAPGDQHKPNGTTTQNPFEEVKPQISEYTAQEIATLQSRLNKRLGPEYISTRAGPGNSRVAYLSAEKAINLANEVFGFCGWSSSIQNIQIDFVDENPTKGTISIGLSVVVRVTLRNGAYHEDTGYGGIENCKSKIAAFEKAKKEGTTDALKRALRNFGNVLGNCIYDKEYIAKVSKVKAGQGKWDVNELYRHADFAPKKEEEDKKLVPTEPQQPNQAVNLVAEESFDVNDFDEADFDDLGNPDEVMLPPVNEGQQRNGPQQHPGRPQSYQQMTPSKPPQIRHDQQRNQAPASRPQQPQIIHQNGEQGSRVAPHLRQNQNPGAVTDTNHPQSRSSSPGVASQHFAPPQAPPGPQSLGFFSARAAEVLDGNNNPTGNTPVAKFNPYSESPSIRKTSGVDHSKSAALNRNTLRVEPPLQRDETLPKLPVEQARKVGQPGQTGAGMSPSFPRMGTSAYRPPTRHGATNGASSNAVPGVAGTERVLTAAKRAPLGDLSNVQHQPTAAAGDGGDLKRQRTGPGLTGNIDNHNTAAPG